MKSLADDTLGGHVALHYMILQEETGHIEKPELKIQKKMAVLVMNSKLCCLKTNCFGIGRRDFEEVVYGESADEMSGSGKCFAAN